MSKYEIMSTFRNLAKSMGFYSRLVNQLDTMSPIEKEKIMVGLEKMNFKDSVDLILYIEG